MRLVSLLITTLLLVAAPCANAAGDSTAVRAIAFQASNEKGPTDPRLAPYESVLRSNLRFESFRYVGESSAVVPAGGRATLALPSGGSVRLEADEAGVVKVQRGGAAITVAPGRPAVFMAGGSGKNGASGVIVMTP